LFKITIGQIVILKDIVGYLEISWKIFFANIGLPTVILKDIFLVSHDSRFEPTVYFPQCSNQNEYILGFSLLWTLI